MAIRASLCGAALILLSACAGMPETSSSASKDAPQDRLAPRDLTQGECGVFVWTSDAARKFIFFSQATNPVGVWWSEKGEIQIQRTASDGPTSFEQSPEQSFILPDGGSLKVTLSEPEDVDNGTRFKSGTIAKTTADGWEKVIPVFGVAACNVRPIGAQYSVRSIR